MKKDKYIAFNNHLLLCIFMFTVMVCFSAFSLREKEIAMAIVFLVIALIAVSVFLTLPIYFTFSEQEIVISYFFGIKERIEWNCIRYISQEGSWVGHGFPMYVISYPVKEKRPFFVRGEISKTRKTKKFIKKFYK